MGKISIPALTALLLSACTEATAFWINPVEPPEDSALVIDVAEGSLVQHAPVDDAWLPSYELMFLDQECIAAPDETHCAAGNTFISQFGGSDHCQIFVIVRDDYHETLAHEFLHCIMYGHPSVDIDVAHAQKSWWSILPAVYAEIAEVRRGRTVER